jgi:hypothetical protein
VNWKGEKEMPRTEQEIQGDMENLPTLDGADIAGVIEMVCDHLNIDPLETIRLLQDSESVRFCDAALIQDLIDFSQSDYPRALQVLEDFFILNDELAEL